MHRRTRVLVARRCCQLALSKPEQLRCLASSTRSGSLDAQLIGAWQSEKIRRYWAVFDCFLRCRRSRRRARRAARHRGQVGRGGTLQLPSSLTLKSIEEAMTILGLRSHLDDPVQFSPEGTSGRPPRQLRSVAAGEK